MILVIIPEYKTYSGSLPRKKEKDGGEGKENTITDISNLKKYSYKFDIQTYQNILIE